MYIGNDLQIAHPSYKIIDDISSGFNGSTTSFALQVSGATPVPFPISTQQVMISVNGVVQEPDPNGSAGFKLLGSNIVFSSAPANGHAFFGVINAGADYVTAGSEFPDGSATAPSFTFQDDQDTGWYRNASGDVGYSSNGTAILNFDGNGLTIAAGKGLTVDTSTLKVDAANNRVGIGLTAPATNFHVKAASPILRLEDSTDPQGTDGSIGKIEFYGNDGSSGGVDVRSYIQTISTNSTGNAHALVIGLGESNNAPTEKIRILGDGKVGIGTTSPTGKLSIASGTYQSTTPLSTADDIVISGNQSLGISLITAAGGTSNNTIAFGDTDDTDIGMIRYAHANNSLQFTTNTAEQMRIDSSGRLLLGTTTEGAAASDDLTIATSGSTGITIRSGTSDTGNIYFSDATSGTGEYAGYLEYSHNTNALVIGTNTSASLTLDSSQNATFAGGISLSATTQNTHLGLLASSTAINFSLGSTSGTSPRMYLYGTGNGQSSAGDIFVGTGTGGIIHFRSAESIKFEVDSDNTTVEAFSIAANKNASFAGNITATSGTLTVGGAISCASELDFTGNGNKYIDCATLANSNDITFRHFNGGSYETAISFTANGGATIPWNNSTRLQTTDAGITVTGAVSDSKGDLRNIPINSQTGAYTLVVGDAGKVVGNTTGGWTIPASVFTTVGQTVTLLNNSGSAQNITASALTYLYNTADGVNIKASTIALGPRAMATIWFDGGATGYIQSSKITVS